MSPQSELVTRTLLAVYSRPTDHRQHRTGRRHAPLKRLCHTHTFAATVVSPCPPHSPHSRTTTLCASLRSKGPKTGAAWGVYGIKVEGQSSSTILSPPSGSFMSSCGERGGIVTIGFIVSGSSEDAEPTFLEEGGAFCPSWPGFL